MRTRLAQTERHTGQAPFVNFWLHNGLLRLDEAKMSKSLGNLVTVRDALAHSNSDALRLYLLSSHYRSSPAYNDEGLEAQERALGRLCQAARASEEKASGGGAPLDPAPFRQRFLEAMDDDLNTPQALATLFDLAREINGGRTLGGDVAQAQGTLRELASVLGLTLETPDRDDRSADSYLELLAELRNELRAAHQYELADRIRERLKELGVALEDGPQGTRWSFRRP